MDSSRAIRILRQVPEPPTPEAPAVVFDIDGTLTPDVTAFTEARPDAASVVQGYADKGYRIVYLSTRIRFLQSGIPAWLEKKGFPASSIHVAQTNSEYKNPASFKTRVMKDYQARGWRLMGGYGDSSSDFEAYANVGIPKTVVVALQRRSESLCQPGKWQKCIGGWAEHLAHTSQKRN